MTIQTVHLNMHTAYLHPSTGSAMLVCPHEGDDVILAVDSPAVTTRESELVAQRLGIPAASVTTTPACPSVHYADFMAALAALSQRGIEPLTDEHGDPLYAEPTPDGRRVLSLCAHDSTVAVPTLAELGAAETELRAVIETSD